MCRGIGSKFAFPYMWTTKIDCVTKGEEEVFNLNPRAFPLERSWEGAMPFIAWVLAWEPSRHTSIPNLRGVGKRTSCNWQHSIGPFLDSLSDISLVCAFKSALYHNYSSIIFNSNYIQIVHNKCLSTLSDSSWNYVTFRITWYGPVKVTQEMKIWSNNLHLPLCAGYRGKWRRKKQGTLGELFKLFFIIFSNHFTKSCSLFSLIYKNAKYITSYFLAYFSQR